MENIPKLARERLKTATPTEHPDADLLTAFAEHSLKGQERALLLQHLAACADCREVVSLAQAPTQAAASPVRQKVSWYSLPVLRWSAAAALVLLVGGAVVVHRQRPSASPAPVAQTASPQVSLDQLSTSNREVASANSEEAQAKKALPDMQKKTVVVSKRMVSQRKTKELAGKANFVFKAPSAAARDATGALALAEPPSPALPAENNQQGASAAKIPSASESVEVTGTATDISGETAEVSKPKEPAAAARLAAPSAGPMIVTRNGSPYGMARAAPSYLKLQQAFPSWSLSATGDLQRSLDSGKTWEKVTVEQGAVFRAISAVGLEVWAGGAAGLLYHSSDSGKHWTRIKPAVGDTTLASDIGNIEFTDALHGKLTTTDGQSWTTSDGGQTWETH